MQTDYGTVQHEGLTLILTQQAYLNRRFAYQQPERNVYQAAAVDDEGVEYEVTWEITNPDAEDEGDACDWDVYSVRKL